MHSYGTGFRFLEVSQESLPKYENFIIDSLRKATAVGFTVHSPISPSTTSQLGDETLEEWYARNKTAALHEEIISVGLAAAHCSEDNIDATTGEPTKIVFQNFNLTTCTMAPSKVRREDMLRMLDLGYDYNYIAGAGIPYYRGRDDTINQSEISQKIRKVFMGVHGSGDGCHPVIVRNGLSDLLMAMSAFVGILSDTAKEHLQRIHDLFPGKVYDAALLSDQSALSWDGLPFRCDFSLDGADDCDVFSLSHDVGERTVQTKAPNTKHPAALDAFENLMAFLHCLSAKKGIKRLLKSTAASPVMEMNEFENRISCPGMKMPVLVEPIPTSRFASSKRKRANFDFTIPLSDVVTDKRHNPGC
ncbi:uncharacterized protein LOC129581767 [Paramacrobiotus metropolitanus]|uniref:uncharacterized protein LOC129581767 n=1 Tax=Paramacrobiotus metropolitanus TaxID=2943436 RepID=UPI0024462507|nr:uncharacterized protein LOC129581767 [Paramacrobiotus metropolitanus]